MNASDDCTLLAESLIRQGKVTVKWFVRCSLVAIACLVSFPARADSLSASYGELPAGTTTDLSATGGVDWIKFGNGENGTSFLNTTKIGNPIFLPATLAPLGTAPSGTVELSAFRIARRITSVFVHNQPQVAGAV
jgi:hypothetical protein